MLKSEIARRDLLRMGLGGLLGVSSSRWLPALAETIVAAPERKRQCILLWMSGGPSQMDTFDMKPEHANGGEFKEVSTRAPGLKFSEHLPMLGQQAEQLAVVRSVSTSEGDHERGTYLMRTGRRPGSPTRFPSIGSALSERLAAPEIALPNYLSINPSILGPAAFGPGFLGPSYAPATVGGEPGGGDGNGGQPNNSANGGFAQLRVENLARPESVTQKQAQARVELWSKLQTDFMKQRGSSAVNTHDTVYRRALDMMKSEDAVAFDLSQESDEVREAYGRGRFGQGCLMARRLIERGVPVVEVSLGDGLGWDTHQQNFTAVERLSQELDLGFGTLLNDLKERGLLETTTILWMGEFGRTPQINSMGGRDHFPNAWSCVFAGGGIAGGQAFGKTSDNGAEVVEGKVNEGDILATLCSALGVDPEHENTDSAGRPHKIAEGTPIQSILA